MFTPRYDRERNMIYYQVPTPPLADVVMAEEAPKPSVWEAFREAVIEACSCCLGRRNRPS